MDTLILGTSPEEGVLMGRPSKYSPVFREQAVELVKATGKTVAEVARDLQINDTTPPVSDQWSLGVRHNFRSFITSVLSPR